VRRVRIFGFLEFFGSLTRFWDVSVRVRVRSLDPEFVGPERLGCDRVTTRVLVRGDLVMGGGVFSVRECIDVRKFLIVD
jgi:hypothetical protein